MLKKIGTIFFDSVIIPYELVALDTRFFRENTCDLVSICQTRDFLGI